MARLRYWVIGAAVCILVNSMPVVAGKAEGARPPDASPEVFPAHFLVNKTDAARIMNKVDELVSKRLYSEQIATNVWPKALQAQKTKILAANNLAELSEAINAAIHGLDLSHCQFVTINDETFYFLHSAFFFVQ